MNKIIILSLLLLIIVPITLSASLTNYSQSGTIDHDYKVGLGFWNDVGDLGDATGRAVTGQMIPLVNDLDGDGTNEIIVFHEGTWRLYAPVTLTLVSSLSAGINNEDIGNAITFDIDGDGFTEIIYTETDSDDVLILEYNGTDFWIEEEFIDIVSNAGDEEMVQCRGVDDCIYLYITTTESLVVRKLNSTNLSRNEASAFDSHAGTDDACFPRPFNIPVVDWDGDGVEEFIFSMATVNDPSGFDYFVYALEGVGDEDLKAYDSTGSYKDGASNCNWNTYTAFSSPLVVDALTGGNMEIFLGTRTDADEFRIVGFNENGTPFDDYPETDDSDGQMVSNLALVDIYDDSEAICVMGYNNIINPEIVVTCAVPTKTLETREFTFTDTGYIYNISNQGFDGIWSNIIHATEQEHDTTYSGVDPDELATTYGIMHLDVGSCSLFGNCDIDLLVPFLEENVLIPVDAEKIGRADLISLTETNLYYYDDGYALSGAEIDYYCIDPCLDQTWKINTTVEITVTAIDPDNDRVSTRVILYRNNSNEQIDGWRPNATSGTTFFFNDFLGNTTIGAGDLRLLARDTSNPSEEDIIDLTFSVGADGVEEGDCMTCVDVTTSQETETTVNVSSAGGTLDTDDNAITNAITTLNTDLNLGLGGTVLWLLIMVMVAIGVWTGGSHLSPQVTAGILIIGEVMMLFIGWFLGFIPSSIIITITVIGVVIVAMMFRRFTTHST